MVPQKLSDLVRCPEFAGLVEGEYRSAAIGYVPKRWENADYVLAGYRNKHSDPSRKGMIALPCGGVREDESYPETAQRETLEETDVETAYIGNPEIMINTLPFLKEYGPVVSIADAGGRMWIYARDSGKRYAAKLIELFPITEPGGGDGELEDPHYEYMGNLFRGSVMPELGLALDQIRYVLYGSEIENGIPLRDDFRSLLKEAILI